MKQKLRTIGFIVLAIGIVLLISGVICMLTVGTFAVPVLLFSSILVNSLGIVLIRS